MEPIYCDVCKKICPNSSGYRKAYFSTTQFGGKLCSTSCCISMIIKCKENKIKCKKLSPYEGGIKIIYTRNHKI